MIDKIIDEYKLRDVLGNYFDTDLGLLLDMASYSIIAENNAGQYYPDYAYNHPLFTEMKMYSDSKVSDFLHSITADQSVGFLNEWNASRNHKDNIEYMDACGYSFVIMVKGMASFVSQMVLENIRGEIHHLSGHWKSKFRFSEISVSPKRKSFLT